MDKRKRNLDMVSEYTHKQDANSVSLAFGFFCYFPSFNDHMNVVSHSGIDDPTKGAYFQFNLLLRGALESPLSTSETLEASILLCEEDVERDTVESISTAVSRV